MTGRARRLAFGAAILAAAMGLGCFLVLRGPDVPSEAQGQAWLTEFADRLTDSRTLKAPEIVRDTGLRGAITYAWQMQDGIFAELAERVQPGGADMFTLLFVRSYAAPTALASAENGKRWMARTVELVTGPDLPNARGPAAARLINADLQPKGADAATCPTMFEANPLTKGPIGSEQSLLLERPDGAPCEQARFSSLSMRIWQREPVAAAAMATRLDTRLGAPAVSRDFDRNTIRYRWPTAHDTAVELTEDVSPTGHYWLRLRAWRPS